MDRCSSKPKKNSIPELPDVIIQHIQSFLPTKQAARTIILSKSWLRSWSIRPFLDFNFIDFPPNDSDTLIELIDTTLEYYVEQGLSILGLRLNAHTIRKRWLKLVLQQNNVIELDLHPREKWKTSFWREIFPNKSLQVLKVVFGGCQLVLCESSKLVLSNTDIKCRNLKKLELHWVYIDYVTFKHIMSSCPLIEELLLYDCGSMISLSDSTGKLEGEFPSLKRLTLTYIRFNEGLHTILSNSPQLEDLTLIRCYNFSKSITLSSLSLKRVEIVTFGWAAFKINAPNLHRLKYALDFPHSTCFPDTSPATKAEITVNIDYYNQEIDASWFHGLTEFLSKLAKSNVKFTTFYDPYNLIVNVQPVDIQPFSLLRSPHQVESLTFNSSFPSRKLLDAFFTICHPKTVLFDGRNEVRNIESVRGLCKYSGYNGNRLECCKLDQNMCRRHNIKDAKFYLVVHNQHRPLHMYEINELGKRSYDSLVISLALEWEGSD